MMACTTKMSPCQGGQSVFSPTKFALPRGCYTNESFVAKMNEIVLNPFTSGGYRFYIYPNSKVFKVDLIKRQDKTPSLSIKITSPLCKVLGWETKKEFNTTADWERPDDTGQWITGTTYSFSNKKGDQN